MRVRKAVSFTIIGALPLLALGCASASGSATPPQDVDLSGTWILDQEASEDLESVMAERGGMVRRGPGPGGMGGGGRVGRGGPPGGGAGGGRVIDRETMRRAMESLTNAPEQFTLEQADSVVTLSDSDGRSIVVPTTGEELKETWFDGSELELKADWRGDALRFERKKGELKAVDTYTRNPDSRRLVVVTTIEGGMGGELSLQHVYDLEEAT